jgi:hypothetical protein
MIVHPVHLAHDARRPHLFRERRAGDFERDNVVHLAVPVRLGRLAEIGRPFAQVPLGRGLRRNVNHVDSLIAPHLLGHVAHRQLAPWHLAAQTFDPAVLLFDEHRPAVVSVKDTRLARVQPSLVDAPRI